MLKKGFTLVELLGIFTIIAIIMLISVPIISGMFKKSEEQKYETFKNNAYLSAESYINDNMKDYPEMQTVGGYVYITFKQLIQNNYMNSTVYDPKTNQTADKELDYTVVATVLSNYTYSYTLSTVKLVKDLIAPKIDGITLNEKVATFTISDNYELQGYAITKSVDVPTSWNNTESVLTYTGTYTATTAGTYYLHVIDYKGNTSYLDFEIPITAFCTYPAGQTWDLAYTGGVQNFTVPCDGTYKLEVWGAQGGNGGGIAGGNGGYSVGTTSILSKNILYVVVGGAGATTSAVSAGGYNGGGVGFYDNRPVGGGGGATHIAKVTGTLASLGYASSVTSGNLLIAAGGGGGGAYYSGTAFGYGGTGGGLNGGGTTGADCNIANGASQTSGGSGGYYAGSFGQGANSSSSAYGGGGGGGLFGGGNGFHHRGGGGGSGYLSSSLTSTSTSNGARGGNGLARITLVSIN